jgi:hypothetical protein
MVCDAYPEEIPEAILKNLVDHRQPYEGDHGIRWELHPDFPEGTNILDAMSFKSDRFLNEWDLQASLAIKRKREAEEGERQTA